MEARLVREELAKCWREEGVNHYQSCHALSEKYLDMLRSHRVRKRTRASERPRERKIADCDMIPLLQVTGYRKLDFTS
jgi:hypothetical protein